MEEPSDYWLDRMVHPMGIAYLGSAKMTADQKQTTQSRKSKWRPEFDEELRRDWLRGVPLLEFARRFGYAKGATGRIRERAIRLGLTHKSGDGK